MHWPPSLLRPLLHSMFLPAAQLYISAHSCYCMQYKSTAYFVFPCLPLGPIHLFLKKIINVWVSSTFIKKRWMISRYASWAVHAVPKMHMGSTKICMGNRAVRETIGSRQYMYCTVLLYCLQYQTCAHIMLRTRPC